MTVLNTVEEPIYLPSRSIIQQGNDTKIQLLDFTTPSVSISEEAYQQLYQMRPDTGYYFYIQLDQIEQEITISFKPTKKNYPFVEIEDMICYFDEFSYAQIDEIYLKFDTEKHRFDISFKTHSSGAASCDTNGNCCGPNCC